MLFKTLHSQSLQRVLLSEGGKVRWMAVSDVIPKLCFGCIKNHRAWVTSRPYLALLSVLSEKCNDRSFRHNSIPPPIIHCFPRFPPKGGQVCVWDRNVKYKTRDFLHKSSYLLLYNFPHLSLQTKVSIGRPQNVRTLCHGLVFFVYFLVIGTYL